MVPLPPSAILRSVGSITNFPLYNEITLTFTSERRHPTPIQCPAVSLFPTAIRAVYGKDKPAGSFILCRKRMPGFATV